jgi:hypothetical protein
MDDLPDDVLLKIFRFYVVTYQDLDLHQLLKLRAKGAKREIESWQ